MKTPLSSVADSLSRTARERRRPPAGALCRLLWRVLQVGVPVGVVVVPFGYAVTGVHNDVLLAAGCGLAVGVGLGLRLPDRIGRSAGVQVGAAVGMAAALLAGLLPGDGVMWLAPPLVALVVGLVDGLGPGRLRDYHDAARETLALSCLLAAGLAPALGVVGLVSCFLVMPPIALVAGAFTPGRPWPSGAERPLRRTLALSSVVVILYAVDGVLHEGMRNGLPWADALRYAAGTVPAAMLVIPLAVFPAARAAAAWLQPRLRVYGQLADYLRVMWVPMGGFAVGYLVIIVVFAGFGGMLARFRPGAFAGAGDAGVGDWVAFMFFRALAQHYPGIVPVSPAAWLLVGAQVVVTVGWALVVFAAVMSSIQPRLERIARQALRAAGD